MVRLLSHTLLAQSRVLIFLALGVSEIIMNLFAGIEGDTLSSLDENVD